MKLVACDQVVCINPLGKSFATRDDEIYLIEVKLVLNASKSVSML